MALPQGGLNPRPSHETKKSTNLNQKLCHEPQRHSYSYARRKEPSIFLKDFMALFRFLYPNRLKLTNVFINPNFLAQNDF